MPPGEVSGARRGTRRRPVLLALWTVVLIALVQSADAASSLWGAEISVLPENR